MFHGDSCEGFRFALFARSGIGSCVVATSREKRVICSLPKYSNQVLANDSEHSIDVASLATILSCTKNLWVYELYLLHHK